MEFFYFPRDVIPDGANEEEYLDKSLMKELEKEQEKHGKLIVSYVNSGPECFDMRDGIVLCIAYKTENNLIKISYLRFDSKIPNSFSWREAGNVANEIEAKELMANVCGARSTKQLQEAEKAIHDKYHKKTSR